MKLFDEIKPIYRIDKEMNNILQDINNKLEKVSISDKQKRNYMILEILGSACWSK